MWRCAGGVRGPAALAALLLVLLLLLARRAPGPRRPRPLPLPLPRALPAEESSAADGNRTRASSASPDTATVPLGSPGGSGARAGGSDPGDSVAFDDKSAGVAANNANEGVGKISDGASSKNSSKAGESAGSAAGAGGAGEAPLTGALLRAGHARAHPELCAALGARVQVLILVTSAPHHFEPRQAVRLTWGHFGARADVALGFVLGEPPAGLRARLAAEDALYGDLIQGNFVDSYKNLTLKTLSMLEWAATYCPRARTLLKADDDVFINVPLLLTFVAERANVTNTIWGKVLHKALPKRTAKSKYYLSPAQFPARVLPDFATGPAYLLSRDVVPRLRDAAPSERYLWLEDVFVTGVLAARLRVRRQHAAAFANARAAPGPCALRRRLALHMVRYHEQFELWRRLLDGRARCA